MLKFPALHGTQTKRFVNHGVYYRGWGEKQEGGIERQRERGGVKGESKSRERGQERRARKERGKSRKNNKRA